MHNYRSSVICRTGGIMKRRFTYVLSMLLLIMLFPTAVRAEGTKTVYLNFGAGHEATAQHYADILMKDADYAVSSSLSGTYLQTR